MATIHYSFPPIVDDSSKILILGSMPGAASLLHHQYYAHPQNVFWKLLFAIYKVPFSTVYEERVRLLLDHNIALWDVLQNCEREGSLDSNICNEVPNDFSQLFVQYPKIEHLFFNGQVAYKYFKKYVGFVADKTYTLLPSTSPAHAGKSFQDKLEAWRLLIEKTYS